MSHLERATELNDLGLCVFPLQPRGKKAIVKWEEYQSARPLPDQITRWWSNGGSERNIAVATGNISGVLVVDIDGDRGAETLAQLQRRHGGLPPTWRSITGKGEHIWFKFPTVDAAGNPLELHNTSGKLGPGIDTRGEGGYVVAPGSEHENGKTYDWQDGCAPAEIELAEAPDWLLAALTAKPLNYNTASPQRPAQPIASNRYALAALDNAIKAVQSAPEGTRNDALNKAAFGLGQLVAGGHLSESLVNATLEQAAAAVGLDPQEIPATVKSGMTAGAQHPREIPERQYSKRPEPRHDPETGEVYEGDWARPLDLAGLDAIPPREWLYGIKLIRKFTTLLVSPGGTGKTAWSFAMAAACTSGEELLHDKPHGLLNVWVYNLEDPYDELRRRIKAVLDFYADRLPPELVTSRLRLNSGRDQRPDGTYGFILMQQLSEQEFVATPDADLLINEIKRLSIDVLIVDPFVMCHEVSENNNGAIERVLRIFNKIAYESNCAILLVHHSRKGFTAGDPDSIRGGTAIVAAARAAFTLAPMSKDDADVFGIPADEQRFLVRLDDAKLNLAPRSDKAQWIKLHSQNIQNGTAEYPNGDNIQVAAYWEPPMPNSISQDASDEILDIIERGHGPDRYSASKKSNGWGGDVIINVMARRGITVTDKFAGQRLTDWIKNGVLFQQNYRHSETRKDTRGLYVNPDNRPGPK